MISGDRSPARLYQIRTGKPYLHATPGKRSVSSCILLTCWGFYLCVTRYHLKSQILTSSARSSSSYIIFECVIFKVGQNCPRENMDLYRRENMDLLAWLHARDTQLSNGPSAPPSESEKCPFKTMSTAHISQHTALDFGVESQARERSR
jgi:hypothetical protein